MKVKGHLVESWKAVFLCVFWASMLTYDAFSEPVLRFFGVFFSPF